MLRTAMFLLGCLTISAQTVGKKTTTQPFPKITHVTGFDTGIAIGRYEKVGALYWFKNQRKFLLKGKPRPPLFPKDCNDRIAPELRSRFYCVER